jgi:glycosyltransferase involved in cell wall biosynthesis
VDILFITHFFPPKYNAGTENYTLGLAQSFLDRGHKVAVLCADGWQTGERYWNGVTKDAYQGVSVQRIHLNWNKAKDPNEVLYDSLQVEKWLDDLFREKKPDLVHVTSLSTLGVGVIRSVARHKIPLVLTLMDFWFVCPRTVLRTGNGQLCDGRTTPWECQRCLLQSSNLYHQLDKIVPLKLQPTLWNAISKSSTLSRQRGARGYALKMEQRKRLMKETLELPDVILSHSRFVQRVFAEVNLSDRVVYLSNGHDLSWLSKYQGNHNSPVIRFGYVGQISEIKGVHLLIQAFRAAAIDNEATLSIWGNMERDKKYAQRLQDLANGLESIDFRGWFQRDQLAQVLSEIDVIVVPSLWYENAPLVISEAFATQTPVIATNLGGMAEAVDHEQNGLLFEFGSVDDLAKQLQRIVREAGLLRYLQVGVPDVKTMDEEVSELEVIYQKILDKLII